VVWVRLVKSAIAAAADSCLAFFSARVLLQVVVLPTFRLCCVAFCCVALL
jgi:hypothetical protein